MSASHKGRMRLLLGNTLVLVAGGRALLGFDPQQVLQALAGLNRS